MTFYFIGVFSLLKTILTFHCSRWLACIEIFLFNDSFHNMTVMLRLNSFEPDSMDADKSALLVFKL